MTRYESILVPEMFLDEFQKLIGFISKNYDWKKHQHLVYIKEIGSIDITNMYKGKKGDKHQVFRNVELKVLNKIPKVKRKELAVILTV